MACVVGHHLCMLWLVVAMASAVHDVLSAAMRRVLVHTWVLTAL